MPVLDLGCGVKNIFEDATHCLDYHYKDAARLRYFRETIPRNGREYIDWDLNNLPLPFTAQYFDKVYMRHSLEHFQKDVGRKIVHDVNRILIDGGTFYVEVPDIAWLASQITINPDLDQKPIGCGHPAIEFLYGGGPIDVLDSHKYGYTAVTLSRLLVESGFQIVSTAHPGNINLAIMARKRYERPIG